MKQDTLCEDYENDDLKNFDIKFKIITSECSWVKQLYDSSTHDWKLIPLHVIIHRSSFLNIIKKHHQNEAVIY